MVRHPLLIASVVLALAPMAPSAALAQEPGVTFDDGPSAKEYAIPLDAARGQTKTKAPTARVRTTPQPAATPPAPPPATTTTATAKPKSSEPKQQPTKTATTKAAPAVAAAPGDPPAADSAPVTTPASSGSDGTDAGLVISGLALAAIALGSLAGLLLRRRRQPVDDAGGAGPQSPATARSASD